MIYERKNKCLKVATLRLCSKKGSIKLPKSKRSIETVIAAKNKGSKETIEEASDLLFHLMLLLAKKDIPLHDVVKTLRKRHKKGNHKHIGE